MNNELAQSKITSCLNSGTVCPNGRNLICVGGSQAFLLRPGPSCAWFCAKWEIKSYAPSDCYSIGWIKMFRGLSTSL